ncbi:MAG: 4a-hydroxytetrahydrobiopterin dehydratase [Rhodoferax sp.]|nr:4a-hydroxytetrahydrobiopterin dehydratase [Rhodoferax sp.]
MIRKRDWANSSRRAMTATEIVTQLARLEGWALRGEGSELSIEKTYPFANYYQTIAFVNAVAFIAHVLDHHPDLSVGFNSCVVRFNTHDVGGVSSTDLEFAARIDAALQ